MAVTVWLLSLSGKETPGIYTFLTQGLHRVHGDCTYFPLGTGKFCNESFLEP